MKAGDDAAGVGLFRLEWIKQNKDLIAFDHYECIEETCAKLGISF
jgi:hypothetical protein